MKRTSNILKTELWIFVIFCVVVVVAYENNFVLPGTLAGNAGMEFCATTVMELLTICLIPVSMRLFRFQAIRNRLIAGSNRSRLLWASLRMLMLCVPMAVNTLFYYWFGFKVAFGYMAIIGLVCLGFVYPTVSRCKAEFEQED